MSWFLLSSTLPEDINSIRKKETCKIKDFRDITGASQVVLVVKNPPANPGDIETWVQPLGGENPLESMAIYFSILAWRNPRTEEPGGL